MYVRDLHCDTKALLAKIDFPPEAETVKNPVWELTWYHTLTQFYEFCIIANIIEYFLKKNKHLNQEKICRLATSSRHITAHHQLYSIALKKSGERKNKVVSS